MPRRGQKPTHSFIDASRGTRIQKVIADAGLASRREAESMITQGLVRVNGELIDALPAWVDPSRVRLYSVGRLDFDSSGLLLMTNDGEFANRLTHPRYEVYKEYELMVKGSLGPEDVDRLEEGIFSPAEKTPGSRPQESHLKILRRDGERTVLTMELREGSNRQIRQLMADLGHPVKRMRRTRMGPVRLRGLAVGAWRDLTHSELSQLWQEAFADVATIQKRRASPSKNVTKSVGKNLRTTSRRSSTPQRTPAKNSNGRSIRSSGSGRRSAS